MVTGTAIARVLLDAEREHDQPRPLERQVLAGVRDVFAGAAIDDGERPADARVDLAADDVSRGGREQELAGSRGIEKRVVYPFG